MKELHIKKLVTLTISILFLGIAINPSITSTNIVEISNDGVNIEIELCGIEKIITQKNIETKYNVKLTEEQFLSLQKIIENVKERIDNCKSRDETFDVLNNAVQSLSDLGILKKDISVEEAQYLVTGINDSSTKRDMSVIFNDIIRYSDEQNLLPEGTDREYAENISEEFINSIMARTNNLSPLKYQENWNLFSLIAGETTETCTVGSLYYGHVALNLIPLTILYILSLIAFLYLSDYLYVLLFCSIVSILLSFSFSAYLSNLNPIPIGHMIGLGRIRHHYMPYPIDDLYPAKGWVKTVGLNGKKTSEGRMYGVINMRTFFGPEPLQEYCPAALGFTGIKINYLDNENEKKKQFYIGTAILSYIGNYSTMGLPSKPTIDGPVNGVTGTEYSYSIISSDLEKDDIYYVVDWGDEQKTYGPYASNKTITINHSWKKTGFHDIKVIAVSDEIEISQWSEPLSISIDKDKSITHSAQAHTLLQRFLKFLFLFDDFRSNRYTS